ncbi:Ig domain protein, group 2 domain protein [Desulforamulus reducens MI-1]|uniref:Ig domain protein, group 2 domain protein n=1 Tax=Desulforamulus reducens (strain ATCC BAA-1160 / DSM 100696 / MI-1) TaxID=349161 RepID=A4J2Q5_DESRM|nr:Ig-like domain-containing protein [Desulforamulus reducens]ABO49358.1 Ig domain protein, group 2 domain protein [Desulforamulus reducens MI-1]
MKRFITLLSLVFFTFFIVNTAFAGLLEDTLQQLHYENPRVIHGKTLYARLAEGTDRPRVVYGTPNDVSGVNPPQSLKNGQYRYLGYAYDGEPFTNSNFPNDDLKTNYDQRNWISEPWNNGLCNNQWNEDFSEDVWNSIFAALPPSLHDRDKVKILVPPTPTTMGSVRAWHQRPDGIWYETFNSIQYLGPASLEVVPDEATVKVGGTHQYHAILHYSDPNMKPQDVTNTAEWSTNVPEISKVNKGLATGLAKGTATITAKHSGLTDRALFRVINDSEPEPPSPEKPEPPKQGEEGNLYVLSIELLDANGSPFYGTLTAGQNYKVKATYKSKFDISGWARLGMFYKTSSDVRKVGDYVHVQMSPGDTTEKTWEFNAAPGNGSLIATIQLDWRSGEAFNPLQFEGKTETTYDDNKMSLSLGGSDSPTGPPSTRVYERTGYYHPVRTVAVPVYRKEYETIIEYVKVPFVPAKYKVKTILIPHKDDE